MKKHLLQWLIIIGGVVGTAFISLASTIPNDPDFAYLLKKRGKITALKYQDDYLDYLKKERGRDAFEDSVTHKQGREIRKKGLRYFFKDFFLACQTNDDLNVFFKWFDNIDFKNKIYFMENEMGFFDFYKTIGKHSIPYATLNTQYKYLIIRSTLKCSREHKLKTLIASERKRLIQAYTPPIKNGNLIADTKIAELLVSCKYMNNISANDVVVLQKLIFDNWMTIWKRFINSHQTVYQMAGFWLGNIQRAIVTMAHDQKCGVDVVDKMVSDSKALKQHRRQEMLNLIYLLEKKKIYSKVQDSFYQQLFLEISPGRFNSSYDNMNRRLLQYLDWAMLIGKQNKQIKTFHRKMKNRFKDQPQFTHTSFLIQFRYYMNLNSFKAAFLLLHNHLKYIQKQWKENPKEPFYFSEGRELVNSIYKSVNANDYEKLSLKVLYRWKALLKNVISDRNGIKLAIYDSILKLHLKNKAYKSAFDALGAAFKHWKKNPPTYFLNHYLNVLKKISKTGYKPRKTIALVQDIILFCQNHDSYLKPEVPRIKKKFDFLLNPHEKNPHTIDWINSISDAKSIAKDSYLPIFLLATSDKSEALADFYKKLDRFPEIVNYLNNFVCVKIDPVKRQDEITYSYGYHILDNRFSIIDSTPFKTGYDDLIVFFTAGFQNYYLNLIKQEWINDYRLYKLAIKFWHKKQQALEKIYFKKLQQQTDNNHYRGIAMRFLAYMEVDKNIRIKKLSDALDVLWETQDRCADCPVLTMIDLYNDEQTKEKKEFWKEKIEQYKLSHNDNKRVEQIYYRFKFRYLFDQYDYNALDSLLVSENDKVYNHLARYGNYTFLDKYANLAKCNLLYNKSLKLYQMAVNSAQALNKTYDLSRIYYNYAYSCHFLGLKRKANELMKNASLAAQETGDLHRMGDVLRFQADYASKKDKETILKRSILLLRKSCNKKSTCDCKALLKLAYYYLNSKRYDESRDTFNDYLDLLNTKRIDEDTVIDKKINIPLYKAQVAMKKQQYDEAIGIIQKAGSSEKHRPVTKMIFLNLLYLANYKKAKYEDAWKYVDEHIELVEKSRYLLIDHKQKSAYISRQNWLFQNAIECACRLNDFPTAFQMMEKSRSRTFLDLIFEKKVAGRLKIAGNISCDNTPLALENELKTKYRDLEVVIEKEEPRIISEKKAEVITLQKFQQLLPHDCTALEYFIASEKLYIAVVTRDNIHIHGTDIKEADIIACVNDYLMTINNSPTPILKNNPYPILIAPIKKLLKTPKLIIIPHRILHYLPFQALQDDDGTFLCQKYQLSYLPSASVMSFLKNRKPTSNRIEVIANPKISANLDLPFSEKEMQNIAALLPQANCYAGSNATETQFHRSAKNAGIIHFACHSIFDRNFPVNSYVLLAPDKTNDGILAVHEIFSSTLKQHPLVILSTCKSALGELQKGDDMIGFTRAFFTAGASKVVASLWSISDKHTVAFMKQFYKHITRGKTPVQSLNATQHDMIKNNVPLANWAAFNIYGTNE